MTDFKIKKIGKNLDNKELNSIGFSKNYTEALLLKSDFLKVKIFDLTVIQANILKQTALSKGCDCAIHSGCLNNSVEKTDAILIGTKSQLKEIIKTLKLQQFKMPVLADELTELLEPTKIYKPKIMGILNLTDDSFSDGGKYLDFDAAIKQAKKLFEDGADIIDIGAESTRPNAKPIDDKIQLERIEPVLKELVKLYPDKEFSIDTRSSVVAKEVLKIKNVIINDVSGLNYDEKMIDVVIENNAKVVICHSSGTPDIMQKKTEYSHLIDDVYKFFIEKINLFIEKGGQKENIIIDVGFGFGKTVEQNFELIKNLKDFTSLGYPILAGISRKSFIQKTVKDADYDELTAALNGQLLLNGVSIFRVHDVAKTKNAIELCKKIIY